MMQLMTGTAREQAGKMGVSFDSYRLISELNESCAVSSKAMRDWLGSEETIPLSRAS